MSKQTKLIIVLLVVAVLAIGSLSLLSPSKSAKLTLSITPSDATITVDGKPATAGTLKQTAGDHAVTVAKEGYLSQSQAVVIEPGKTTDVTIQLRQKTDENVVIQSVTTAVFNKYPNYPLKVLSTKLLYDGEWIVAHVQGDSDPGYVVLKRDMSSTGYGVYLGPGTSFDPNFVAQLPPDVQQAMKENR